MKKYIQFIMNGQKILGGQLHWRIRSSVIVLFFCLSFFFCNDSKTKKNKLPAPVESSIPTDQNGKPLSTGFLDFYQKFHEDSIFQIQHIAFPLKGMPDYADPVDMKENEFYYTADQWKIQKRCDPATNEINYINLGDVLIEEKIVEKEHGLMVIRRFAKNSSGWNLIYYAGLNKYKISPSK